MLKIVKTTPNLLYEAQNELPESYIKVQEKKHTFIESIISRYLIFSSEKFLAQTDKNWVPEFIGNRFWSISHKENLVFVWSGTSPMWVDIEIIQERSREVFWLHSDDEYEFFWDKTMVSFYLLWVLKESALKLNLAWLDDIKNIHITSLHDFSKHIEWVKFQFKFFGNFQNKNFVWYIGIENELVYAVSYYL